MADDHQFAVFPLNIVVLPEESVALHLFEPRYRELFKNHRNGEEFVIVYRDRKGTSAWGTLVFIDKIINEFPDETVDVIVTGSSIVKIEQFLKADKHLYQEVIANIKEVNVNASNNLRQHFEEYLKHLGKVNKREYSDSLFYMANRIELSHTAKNKFLSLQSNQSMNAFLINQIRFLESIHRQEEQLNKKFHLN
jgi:Lon protease-like protein